MHQTVANEMQYLMNFTEQNKHLKISLQKSVISQKYFEKLITHYALLIISRMTSEESTNDLEDSCILFHPIYS